ncbi:MAG: choice-of-anchor D domain-containing protein, partial [Bacteroidota bacterium]|nr:choice-of-anchor D domain-containing protein [Bacteroidota bacterium]
LEVNNPVTRTVTLRNNGSVELCYDRSSANFPPLAGTAPSTPFCIDPGDSLEVEFTFNATNPGSFVGTMTMFVDAPCADSTVFDFRATVQEGALTQVDTVRLAPDFWCMEREFVFDIRSTYLETVTLESVQLEGADAAFFTMLTPDPAMLPISIGSGATEPVVVQLIPDESTKTYTATLVSRFTAFGSPVERRTVLIARAVVPTLTVTAATYPTTVLGQSGGTQQLVIENTCELPLAVSSATVADPSFVLQTVNPAPPVTLQPGATIIADVEFLPQAAGVITDSLLVRVLEPCAMSAAGRLEGEGIPQPIVEAVLRIGQLSAEVDDLIDIAVEVDQDLGPAEVTGWTGAISFNRSMLYPVEVIREGTLSSAMQVDMQYDNAAGEVTLTASGGRLAAGTGNLVIVRCLVLVGNSLSTPLRLSEEFAFTDGYARVTGRSDGSFDLLGYCLPDDRLMTDIPGFRLQQNRPNPVSSGDAPAAMISYEVPEDMSITLDLYDMIGRHVASIDQGFRQRGVHTVNLSVTALEPGTYVYVLRSARHSAVRRMIIMR